MSKINPWTAVSFQILVQGMSESRRMHVAGRKSGAVGVGEGEKKNWGALTVKRLYLENKLS